MTVNFASVGNFIKKYVWTKKGIAICVTLAAIAFAFNLVTHRVMPMSYGADAVGADPTDLMATGLSVLTAVISFVASNYLGVKPEVIAAVIAFEKDKTNPENQRRLGAAILGYLIGFLNKHPDGSGSFVLTLLTTLIQTVEDPAIKTALSGAASAVAASQFGPIVAVPAGPIVVGPITIPGVK